MRFYKTSEYAIRVLVFLASKEQQRFSVRELHQKLKIPYKYLSRLMHQLADSGFVEVTQGKTGGYRIARNKADVYLHQIIDAVEGLENYDRCILGFKECSDENPCSMHQFWVEERERIKNILYSISLEDLASNPNIKY